DQILENRGYQIEHCVDNMVLDLNEARLITPQHIEYEFYGRNSGLPSIVSYDNDIIIQLRDRITEEWVEALFRLNGTTNPTLRRIVPSMYHAIPKELIVARIEIDGRMVASGLGILDRDHIGIYAIYVDPSCRGKHFGTNIVNTILLEGQKKGYHKAYLQCVKGNHIGKHMYENFGFKTLYECYFRVNDKI
ncbi:MAG: GNAT family N-acetyltransferase, partial [Erysipelotrichaceae bacterium]|nr:GNAT family N-acetyltransferase [Erysipelotrichaceae bacterium]